MIVGSQHCSVDVRALSGTRETLAYQDGGLFPVLTTAPNGAVVAVLRGGAGHLGLDGRIEVIRSLDGGLTWTPPNVVADGKCDDRNPALGVSHKGTLILSYHRQCSYDERGAYRSLSPDDPERRVEVVVTRSLDAGLTWEKPSPLGIDSLQGGSAFGKIVSLADGTLLMPVYSGGSYLARSRDDGKTWEEPSLIAEDMNETALIALADGQVLAVMRGWKDGGLHSIRSLDGGLTWHELIQVTGPGQHPADLVMLANGDILLTYGNRKPPFRIEGLVSRNGGHTWLDCLLTFSGHLYGYDIDPARRTDLGYPSSIVLREAGVGQGITMYYYNPSIGAPPPVSQPEQNTLYLAHGYRAIAVTWSEQELIAALDSLIAR